MRTRKASIGTISATGFGKHEDVAREICRWRSGLGFNRTPKRQWSIEHHDLPDRLALVQQIETMIDFIEL